MNERNRNNLAPPSQNTNSTDDHDPLACSVDEGCKLLGGIGRTLMYDLIGAELVKSKRLGGRTVIPIRVLNALLERPQAEIDAVLAAFREKKKEALVGPACSPSGRTK